MKTQLILSLAVAALVAPLHAEDKAPATTLKDARDKAGYSIGVNIGSSMKRDGVDLNLDALVAGLRDAFTGGKQQLTPEEQQAALQAFQQEMQTKLAGAEKGKGDAAKKAGEDFLAANKSKEGVKTTKSGLQYKVLTEGKGDSPKATDSVTVHYRGTLVDGTEFDSSYKRGEPTTFPVNGVIPGWTEALQLMKPGAKYQLFIPSELAYGDRGTPDGSIPGNSTLIFEVELLKVGA
jgi:FKBP-type peptidyl-prolyl cis-trans isomerase